MRSVLEQLRDVGVRLSVDDFGTGHTSLDYLRACRSRLKIDRSFVSQMATSEEDAVIVRSTIDLGRNLGLGVVAEGVEDPEVLEELRRLGCDSPRAIHEPPDAGRRADRLAGRVHGSVSVGSESIASVN